MDMNNGKTCIKQSVVTSPNPSCRRGTRPTHIPLLQEGLGEVIRLWNFNNE